MKVEEFVLTDNIDLVLTKITKLNKKAVKLNVQPIVVTVTKETKVEVSKIYRNGKEVETSYHFTKLIIEGETPKLNGWELVAVKHHEGTGLLINSVPEKEMPVEFRTTGDVCEHCGHNRRRNTTYILEKELGELTEDEMRYI